jgi:hypothetical protein
MKSLSLLRERLKIMIPDSADFKLLDTRIMLRTGVSLLYFKDRQNEDENLIGNVLKTLEELGYRVDTEKMSDGGIS